MIKRVLLHISFWLLYLLQDLLLGISWIESAMGNTLHQKLWSMSLQAVLVIFIPKLLLSYYLLLVSSKEIVKGDVPLYRTGIKILMVYSISILLYRAGSFYYVFPVVYQGVLQQKYLLDIQSVIIAIIDIGFIAGLALTLKFIRIQTSVKEREKTLIKEKLGAELKFLRNQMSPHFLLNTLNNIYALARKKSSKTADVVMRLSELLRFILYDSDGTFNTLKDEIKLLEGYLELEMIRYNQRLSVSFNKQVDDENYFITPLILLPFVENAFKHGISETRFESFIHIDLIVKQSMLNFAVENSTEQTNSTNTKNNIGLYNVRRQLEITYKNFSLSVKNEGAAFKTLLQLDLNSHVEI